MRARRAVVTGGAGFLGSHICEELLRRDVEVVCLDSFLTGTPDNVAHLMGRPRVLAAALRRGRVRARARTGRPGPALRLAGLAGGLPALPLETLKVGSIGTWHALGLAKEKRARFLLASTSEVYGDPRVHPQPEDYWGHVNPVGPRGVYDEAKRYGEALTMAYHRAEGLDTAIVRIFNTLRAADAARRRAGGADVRQPGAAPASR